MIEPLKQIVPRRWGEIEMRGFPAAVARVKMSGLKFRQKLRPLGFGFSDEDHIRVPLRFLGHQRYMRASQHNGDSALSEAACNVIGVRRTWRVKSNRNEVRLRSEVDRRHRFIHVEHGPMRRHKRGQVWHCHLLEVQHAGPPHPLNLEG